MAHFSRTYPRFFTAAGQIPEIIPFIDHRSLGEGWFTRLNFFSQGRRHSFRQVLPAHAILFA